MFSWEDDWKLAFENLEESFIYSSDCREQIKLGSVNVNIANRYSVGDLEPSH